VYLAAFSHAKPLPFLDLAGAGAHWRAGEIENTHKLSAGKNADGEPSEMSRRSVQRLVGPALCWGLAVAPLSCGSDDVAPARDARAVAHGAGGSARPRTPTAHEPTAELGPSVRYVVYLGDMRDGTRLRRDDLGRVLRAAARARARELKDAAVAEDADGSLVRKAAERHLPVITLDGVVTELTESPGTASSALKVRASVEFALRREQILKATLSGAATSFGSSPTISDQGRRRLEGDAIDGAVQSALRGADEGLTLAAR
jgi:hypothetical protein